MKVYRVARSIFGELGSLKRNQVLAADDPRIINNATAVKDLLKRKLLVEGDGTDETQKPKPAKSKSKPKPADEPDGSDEPGPDGEPEGAAS